MESSLSTSKILCDLNEEFHQYEPPAIKIPFDVINKYNVFLSFRGKDVRTTLVDHLFEALSGAGLRVFLDSEELGKGKEIESSLKIAIQTSDIFIPIFSRNYAKSAWCLKEAAQMCRCNGLIIPLFYDVKPSDVRYPQREGSVFEGAFKKHYSQSDRQDEKTIEEWKNALHQISSLSGRTRADELGYEERLIKRVVKDVLNTLKISPLDVPLHLVGLEKHISDLLTRLRLNSCKHTTVRVGVGGLGGIGKTTLVKAVYNRIYAMFDAHFFAQKITTLEELQRGILRRLVNYRGEVSSVAEGKALMKNLLRGSRVLVILDNVNDMSHLNAVNENWSGPGSRIIITSRDRFTLFGPVTNLAKLDSVLQMGGLGKGEALQLFSWHAFLRPFPEATYNNLSTRIARACWGHPLSLQVIGAHLFDKKEPNDIQCWEEALHNIGENQEISRVLRISYDGLSHVEKEMFLDIACCFAGERKTDVVTFWEALYPDRVQTALKNLWLKMLISYSGPQNLLDIHDLLRGMGRGIEQLADNNSRLCLPAKGAQTILNRDRAEKVKMLVYAEENVRNFVSMRTMPSLRYLALQNTKVFGNIGNIAPNLLWIKIKNCEFVSDTRTWLIKPNRFQLDSSLSQVKILSVEHCASLTSIPKTVDGMVNLQCVYLRDCVALTTLPNTLGCLSQVKELSFYCCTNLRGLPNSVGNLRQLKILKLIDCTRIKSLPSSVGNLGQLEVLNLRGCSGLRNLPNTIGDLAKLHYLFIRGCSGLQSLHYPLDKLQNLRRLCITTPAHPESFHNWVSELAQRRKLNRSVGLGSLVEKKFNVYFVYHTADEREILMGDKYKYLRTGSLCVCRDSKYNASSDIREAFGSSDILVPVFSKNFVSSIVCMKNYVAMNYSSGLVIPLVLRTYTWPYCYKYLKTMRKLNYQTI